MSSSKLWRPCTFSSASSSKVSAARAYSAFSGCSHLSAALTELRPLRLRGKKNFQGAAQGQLKRSYRGAYSESAGRTHHHNFQSITDNQRGTSSLVVEVSQLNFYLIFFPFVLHSRRSFDGTLIPSLSINVPRFIVENSYA